MKAKDVLSFARALCRDIDAGRSVRYGVHRVVLPLAGSTDARAVPPRLGGARQPRGDPLEGRPMEGDDSRDYFEDCEEVLGEWFTL